MKKRLDQHLVDQGLAPSKTKAQELIEAGQIAITPKLRTQIKPSLQIDPEQVHVTLLENNILKYVARSGLKLEYAIKQLGLEVAGKIFLDVGQSTGGFTDCLLQMGADHVTGVDVATNELAHKLRGHTQVTAHFGVNARELLGYTPLRGRQFDGAVVDVSFISLSKVLTNVVSFIKPSGFLLSLLKPQFEVGSVNIDKKGIVKSQAAVENAIQNIHEQCQALKLTDIKCVPSQLKGRDGNQEFFIYGVKKV